MEGSNLQEPSHSCQHTPARHQMQGFNFSCSNPSCSHLLEDDADTDAQCMVVPCVAAIPVKACAASVSKPQHLLCSVLLDRETGICEFKVCLFPPQLTSR